MLSLKTANATKSAAPILAGVNATEKGACVAYSTVTSLGSTTVWTRKISAITLVVEVAVIVAGVLALSDEFVPGENMTFEADTLVLPVRSKNAGGVIARG